MSADRALPLTLGAWQKLFSLSHKEAEDRALLERQLRRWCRAHGSDAAALYCSGDGAYELHLTVGKARFPEAVQGGGTNGWSRIELPAALLLHRAEPAAVDASAADPTLLLLAAGARISALKRQLLEHSFQARFRGVELEALYEVGLAIASTLDLDELGEGVLLRAVSLLDARRGALYLIEDGSYRLNRTIGGGARESFATDAPGLEALLAGQGRGPEGLLPGASHLLAVPVEIERDPRGLLVVADKESRRGVGPFPSSDRRTLALFANQAAIALENAKLHRLALEKERLEREMELAAEIQQQILPKGMPAIAGYELVGWNRPARQVGGDFYDVRQLAAGRWCLAVGDVTGKGMPAALLVSTLHSALRLLLDRIEMGPCAVERLNQHIYEASAANKFITLLLAELDAAGATLAYVNAGHNPGLVMRRDRTVEELAAGGLPLGLLEGAAYQADQVQLEPDDLVCLYSDGITECAGDDEQEFGQRRLVELLAAHRGESLAGIVAAIDRAVTDYAGGRPQGDDQTVVLLRRSSG